jgi:amino acid adenylation domain-containing protein/non-ribosomal peptide synthase protein (TIGR01720 family)
MTNQTTLPSNLSKKTNLTRAQFLMWLGQHLNPDTPIYNMPLVFRIDGPISIPIFQEAFQCLINDSDTMRMVVKLENGIPMQRVLPTLKHQMLFFDFSDDLDPESSYIAWQQDRVVRRIDLSKMNFDTALIKLSDQEFIWFFNQHHVYNDGWSVTNVFRYIAERYRYILGSGTFKKSEIPSYQKYTLEEKLFRQTDQYQKAEQYWQDKAKALLEPTQFYGKVYDQTTFRTNRVVACLNPQQSQMLREFAAEHSNLMITEHMVLASAFLTVLYAYIYRVSGKSKIAIGTPFHNRATVEHRDMIGLFLEIGPTHIEIDDNETYDSLFNKVISESFNAMRHWQPGISSSTSNRSYDVLLNYISASFPDFNGMPVKSHWIPSGYTDSNHVFRLTVHDFDSTGNFTLYFDLNEHLFDQQQMEWAVQHFTHALDAFLSDFTQIIDTVALITDEERERFLVEINKTSAPYPVDKTVIDLFEEQVEKTPDAIAVRMGVTKLTYCELINQVNVLANELLAFGTQPETLIAIFIDHTIEAVVSLLSVLKAGGAYVPIDSSYPSDRISFMLADTKASIILTQSRLLERLPENIRKDDNINIILLDGKTRGEIQRTQPSPSLPSSHPENLAYVIYTSGSTGVPKGVMVTHQGMTNYVWWARKMYAGKDSLSFPLFSSLSFDLTVTSIFVPLITGGQIVVYPDEGTKGLRVLEVIEENAVDIIKLTPSHLSLIKEMGLGASRIKQFIVGGEDFKRELAYMISDSYDNDVAIYNEYGPTETVVACMIHRFDPKSDTEPSVSIGTPSDNARIYLLDDNLNPVPVGVVGEIYIGGERVARGYLNRPRLSAERFLPDPYAPEMKKNTRMYKTGDLGRWMSNGKLAFLGRKDNQVKIGGARIELGEVEAAFSEHPDIEDCVVTVHQSTKESAPDQVLKCIRCGLPNTFPEVTFDSQGLCSLCSTYDVYKEKAESYFKTIDDLKTIFSDQKSVTDSEYDCLVLLSGGKDSTYMLYQIVELGLNPLVFSLDNGYISDQAKGNIKRVVDSLGVDHIFGTTPHMPQIFSDSLLRFSNVCNGCFKVIYTLAFQLARQKGIRYIVTGLSRGQIFETRLEPLMRGEVYDINQIDDAVLQARKVYHRMNDAVSQNLDVSMFQDDRIFDEVQYIDFYRYWDVGLDEVYSYLKKNAPWIRPTDTGRSTNCIINDVGIYIHKKERGFHNYALPYSWDVRLGHKTREEALAELDDEIDMSEVKNILNEVQYDENQKAHQTEKRLAAYYTTQKAISISEIRKFLVNKLPSYMIPSYYVRLDEIPLTPNGKVNRENLPAPEDTRPELSTDYAPPETKIEGILAKIWAEAFGLQEIGIHDNFFDLGGDSIINIQITTQATQKKLFFTPKMLFENPTIASLAEVVEMESTIAADQGQVTGSVPLTPIQHWFFNGELSNPHHYNQAMLVETNTSLNKETLEKALYELALHHDTLRSRFTPSKLGWKQEIIGAAGAEIPVTWKDLSDCNVQEQNEIIEKVTEDINASLNISHGPIAHAAFFKFKDGKPRKLLIIAHHLVIDSVSWRVLFEDLETALRIANGEDVSLPAKTSSIKQWAEALTQYAQSKAVTKDIAYWKTYCSMDDISPIPVDHFRTRQNNFGDVITYSLNLDKTATLQLLQETQHAYNTKTDELLLTGLAKVLTQWTKEKICMIDVEGHGREEIDQNLSLLRTIGWFTSIYPVMLRLPQQSNLAQIIMTVKEQLRQIPNRGFSNGLLRYLNDAPLCETLTKGATPQILFNYLGQFDQMFSNQAKFRLASPITVSNAPKNQRRYAIELITYILSGKLYTDWIYNEKIHDRATIHKIASDYLEGLQAIISHCVELRHQTYTPSDFPDVDLDQNDLDSILSEFGE